MKYNIFDFNQEAVLSLRKEVNIKDGIKILSLDVNDLLILSVISDCLNRPKFYKYIIDDKTYTSIQYKLIIEDLPILNIKQQALTDRLNKMCELGILEKKVIKNQNGTFTAFRLGENYEFLKYSKPVAQVVEQECKSSELPPINYSTNNSLNNKKDISNDISKNKNFDDYEVVDDGMKSKSQEKEANEKSCAKKDKLKLIEEDFYNSLRPFVEEFGKDTVRAFFDYWTEPNKSNTKLKFQMERTWDAKKRLIRWRDNNFGNNKSQSKYSAPPPKSRLETNMSAAAEAAELLKQIREKENLNGNEK